MGFNSAFKGLMSELGEGRWAYRRAAPVLLVSASLVKIGLGHFVLLWRAFRVKWPDVLMVQNALVPAVCYVTPCPILYCGLLHKETGQFVLQAQTLLGCHGLLLRSQWGSEHFRVWQLNLAVPSWTTEIPKSDSCHRQGTVLHKLRPGLGHTPMNTGTLFRRVKQPVLSIYSRGYERMEFYLHPTIYTHGVVL